MFVHKNTIADYKSKISTKVKEYRLNLFFLNTAFLNRIYPKAVFNEKGIKIKKLSSPQFMF
jgi:hypothetical protein